MENEKNKLLIESIDQLRQWLIENHEVSDSVWLVKWKKASGRPYVSYDEIVDQLLCFGWIDSVPRKLDNEKSMLLISPRNPKSNWSGVNKRKVQKLIEAGLMQTPGFNMIEIAKQNGTWDFLDDVEALIIPPDLQKELETYENAVYLFNRFPDSSKRGILEWIKNAKQPATRDKRIQETAKKAEENIKANHPKGRDKGPKIIENRT